MGQEPVALTTAPEFLPSGKFVFPDKFLHDALDFIREKLIRAAVWRSEGEMRSAA